MKSEFFRKAQYPVLLTSMLIPVSLILLAFTAPEALTLSWLLPGLYLLEAWLLLNVPGKLRLVSGLFAGTLLLALAYWITLQTGCSTVWISAALYVAALLLGLPMAGWSWDQEFPGVWLAIGTLIQIAAQLTVFGVRRGGSVALEPVTPWLFGCFMVFVPLAMLCINRKNLVAATMGKQRVSSGVQRKNAAIVLLFFALLVLIGMLPVVADAIGSAWNWLVHLMTSLKLSYSQDKEVPMPQEPTAETEPEDFSGLPQPGGPNPVLKYLSDLIWELSGYVVIVVLAVLAIALTIWLVKILTKLVRQFLGSLNHFARISTEDYVDEVTDTRDSDQLQSRSSAKRLRQLAINERRLPPRERIRFRYRRLLKKHPQWSRSSTARTNLPPALAQYYEQARYSDRELTEADAQQFISGVKQI